MTTGRQPPPRETRTQAVLAQLRTSGLAPGTAIFTHDTPYGAYIWNVTAALALIQARPRPAHIVSPQLMQQTLGTATVDRTQIATARPEEPGLVAVYFDLSRHFWRWVVIDGNHRAHKAHQTGYPFACYELNPGESWRVLLAYPSVVDPAVYLKHQHCTGNCLRTASPLAPLPPAVRTFRRAPVHPARVTRAQGRRWR